MIAVLPATVVAYPRPSGENVVRVDRSHALFVVMCVIWGATWIAVKAGIAVVPPILFAGTRFVVAGLLLLFLASRRGETARFARGDALRFAAVTMLMIVVTYGLLFWGIQYVSSGLAAILDLAFMPVALLAIGAAFGEDRLTLARAVGVAIGVTGLLILFGPKAVAGTGGGATELVGGAAIVLSAFVYSLGSVLARPLLQKYSPVLVAGITTLAGGCLMVAGALAVEPGARQAIDGRWGVAAWAGWVFLVLCGSLMAYTIFLHLIREWGASRAGSYAFVSPIIAVVLGVLVFGEAVTWSDEVGMATMLAGAWFTLRPA